MTLVQTSRLPAKRHLQSAGRAAGAIMAVMAFIFLGQLFGQVLFGLQVSWQDWQAASLISGLLGALGGFVYSFLRPRFRRAGRAGAVAGAIAALPAAAAYFRQSPGPGEFAHWEFALFTAFFGAALGAGMAAVAEHREAKRQVRSA